MLFPDIMMSMSIWLHVRKRRPYKECYSLRLDGATFGFTGDQSEGIGKDEDDDDNDRWNGWCYEVMIDEDGYPFAILTYDWMLIHVRQMIIHNNVCMYVCMFSNSS